MPFALIRIERFDSTILDRFSDYAGCGRTVLLLNAKSLTETGVRHRIPLDTAEAGMEIAGPHSIRSIHFGQSLVSKQDRSRRTLRRLKGRCGELVKLSLEHNLVNAAATLLGSSSSLASTRKTL